MWLVDTILNSTVLGVYPLVVLFLLTPGLLEICFVYMCKCVCICTCVHVCVCMCVRRVVRHALMSVWERCKISHDLVKTLNPQISWTQNDGASNHIQKTFYLKKAEDRMESRK